MKIGIIGAGRLGICFALLCEAAGYEVVVSDIREDYVNDLNQRKIETTEPEVENLLKVAKNFEATSDNRKVIRECDIVYTLVPTPSLDDGSYDVSAVWKVVEDIKDEMKIANYPKNFIIGCTTNPGDCDLFRKELPDSVKVFYNPEFIAQGSIVRDLRTADMVLLGCDSSDVDELVSEIKNLYESIQTTRAIVCVMSNKSAEITKIALNCFLTTKISYANMLGDVLRNAGCGDEITTVLGAIGSDSRVGRKYLGYGFGYGGPCFPRDNRAFASFARSVGLDYNLGFVTDEINNQHAKLLCDYYNTINENLPFYFSYITYKKGTDILTESQQYRLCIDLLEKGRKVYIHNDTRVIPQIRSELIDKYGDRVKIVDNKQNITEKVFIIEL
tara:strand:+ start:612 stop:1772 length:1161 start_codon:yes stop_codon:yes gene_type:complete